MPARCAQTGEAASVSANGRLAGKKGLMSTPSPTPEREAKKSSRALLFRLTASHRKGTRRMKKKAEYASANAAESSKTQSFLSFSIASIVSSNSTIDKDNARPRLRRKIKVTLPHSKKPSHIRRYLNFRASSSQRNVATIPPKRMAAYT